MSGLRSNKRQSPPFAPKPSTRKGIQCKFEITQKILENLQCFIRKQSVKPEKKRASRIKSLMGAASTESRNTDSSKEKERVRAPSGFVQKVVDLGGEARKKESSESPDLAKTIMNEVICSIENQVVSGLTHKQPPRRCQQDYQLSLQKVPQTVQKIWTQPSECHRSNISTQGTLLSSGNVTARNNYYNGGGYLMLPVQHYSFNNSFTYEDKEKEFPQRGDRDRERLRLFEISYEGIERDGRTTVMIKNIPNRYTLPMLADEIDESFKDGYDFLYLPFDLENNCNVGYAFINMLDFDLLKRFYKHFNHRRWMKFRSEKICALAYARLQGRQDLIEHFSNSKVLNQKEKRYRPIIKPLMKQTGKLTDLIESQRKMQNEP